MGIEHTSPDEYATKTHKLPFRPNNVVHTSLDHDRIETCQNVVKSCQNHSKMLAIIMHTCAHRKYHAKTIQPAKAKRARLNIGLRGEQSLSASLSGTRRSSLPFSEDRLLL
jgi:hypothetical protein